MKTSKGKPVSKMSLPEFQRFRVQNPYSSPHAPGWTNPMFWTTQQLSIVTDIYSQFKNKVTSMWAIDIDHMKSEDHKEYFKDALALCEEFDLIKLMDTQCDMDPQLIQQWYATIHFGTDDHRTISWMTRDQ